ncbi:MAG: AbrB family transcriptional regulator [Synechococcus sp.]
MPAKSRKTPLTGKKLKAKVQELIGANKKEIAKACGYTTKTKTGQERINLISFYNALLEAEGMKLEAGPSEPAGRGRPPTYRITVHKNGTVLIGSAYTKEMGLNPGDEFVLRVTKNSIKLTLVD